MNLTRIEKEIEGIVKQNANGTYGLICVHENEIKNKNISSIYPYSVIALKVDRQDIKRSLLRLKVSFQKHIVLLHVPECLPIAPFAYGELHRPTILGSWYTGTVYKRE